MKEIFDESIPSDRAQHERHRRIPLFKVHVPPRESLLPRLEAVLYGGQIGDGEIVKQFEEAFGRFVGNPRALALSSGTAALHTALREQQRVDFLAGRTLRVTGWLLARSEARLAALAALVKSS